MKNEIEYEAIINSYRKQVEEIGNVKLKSKLARKLKRIAATAYLIGGLSISAIASLLHGLKVQIAGRNYISSEYSVSEILSSHKVSINPSTVSGLVITMNKKQVSLDYYLNVMKDSLRRKNPEITDAELKIALENTLPSSISIDEYFPGVTSNDLKEASKKGYYDMKAEEASKGVSK